MHCLRLNHTSTRRRAWTNVTQHALDTAAWLHEIAPDDLRRTVDVLYRVHRLVTLVTDLPTLLHGIMEESKQVAHAEACSLLLYDAITDELYFEVALGETGDQNALKRGVRLKLGQGIAGTAASTRHSITVADAGTDERSSSRPTRPVDSRPDPCWRSHWWIATNLSGCLKSSTKSAAGRSRTPTCM